VTQDRLDALDHVANLRDVAHTDPRVRRDVLWRSAQPVAGDGAPGEVTSWPPATVLDLRSAGEIPEGPHPLLPGPGVHNVVLLDHAGDPNALAQRRRTLVEVYLSMLEPGTGLIRAVELVASEPPPVLVHCAAGKDRTGLVVALVLRLLGIGRDAVVADFALTTDAMPDVMRRLVASSPLPAGADLSTLPAEYFTAPTEALTAVLDVWDGHAGGVEGWASSHGAAPDLVDRLRGKLLR
jgi:hypothetical protein